MHDTEHIVFSQRRGPLFDRFFAMDVRWVSTPPPCKFCGAHGKVDGDTDVFALQVRTVGG